MNIHGFFTDFTNRLPATKLSDNEEIFINESFKTIKNLKENNSLIHVVQNSITKHLHEFQGYGMSLSSIEKVFQQIDADSNLNQDQEFIIKIKKIFLEKYVSVRCLSENVDTNDIENLLAYILTKDMKNLFYNERSFFESLSAQSQIELIKFLATRGESEAMAIRLYCFDKIKDLPIESRLEIAILIASQGEKAVQRLCPQLADLHLQTASIEQKLDLVAFLLEKKNPSNDSDSMWQGFLNLQPKEPKEEYLAFLKALIQKHVIDPHNKNIDLNKLTDKDISVKEKITLAKEVISFNKIATQYVINFITEIHDIELVTLLSKEGGTVFQSVLENLASFNLKEVSIEERLELAKVISTHWSRRDGPSLFKIIDEVVNSGDSLENRIHLVNVISKNLYSGNEEKAEIMEAVFKNKGGEISLQELINLIKKNNDDSKFIIENFNYFNASVSGMDTLGLISIIFDQGKDLTNLLAFCLKKFNLQNASIPHRLETIKRILEISPEADRGIARNLDSILNDLTISERLGLAKTLIQRGSAAAEGVAYYSDALKLNDATLQERVELALMIIQKGRGAARNLAEKLGNFYLREASSGDLLRLAEAFLEKGVVINMENPKNFNMEALSIDERFYLVSKMITKQAFIFDPAWMKEMPWEYRCKLVKQAISHMIDSHTPDYSKIFQWDLHDVPFNEKLSIIKLYMQIGAEGEYSLKNAYLSFFGESIKGDELITVLKLFSRQSISLLSQALEQLKSPPLSIVVCQQAFMEFVMDTPLDLQLIYQHPALQAIKPLLNLLTMKTLDVQEAVNLTHSLPKDVHTAKLQLKNFLNTKEEYKSLRALWDEIEKIDNPMLQFKLMRWLAYTTGKFSEMSKERGEGASKMLETIYNHQSLPNRFIFVRELSHMAEPFKPRIVKDGKGELKDFNEYAKLSWILLTKFKSLGVSNEQLEKINDIIDGKKKFKETKNFSVLVELFNEVLLMPPLKPTEAKLFCDRLEEIIQLKTMEQTLQGLQGLTNILTLFGRDNFIKALSEKDINAFFFKEFEKNISIGNISDFGSKWQKTFGKSRNPGAIFIYMRSLEKLPQEERKIATGALGRFIKAVLNGDFPAVRYKTENEPHLTQIFANAEIKKLWLDKGKPIEVGNYTLSFSDDFMDLLLSGTEVQGSCQHIAEDPHLNKCLIAFLNGEVMPLLAKPKGMPEGKIAARIFLRLGWDKIPKCHLILQESIYSNVNDAKLHQAMNQMALDKAKQLNISLVEHDKYRKTHEAPYAGTFSYLGGNYPYVYSDAAGGVKNGIEGFDIKECHLITSATS